MLKKNCNVQMEERDDALYIVLKGEIDHHSAVRVRGEIDECIAEIKPKRAVFDLENIEFMDSSGLGLIMGRYARMQAVGGELIIRKPNERIVKIFKLAGFDKKLKIQTEEKEDEN